MASEDRTKSFGNVEKYINQRFQTLKSEIVGQIGEKTDILFEQIENIQERVQQMEKRFEKYLGNMKEFYAKAHNLTAKRRRFKASFKQVDMQEFQETIQNPEDFKQQAQSNISFDNKTEKGRKRGKMSKTMKGLIDIARGVRTQKEVARQLKVSIVKLDAMLNSYLNIQQTQ